MQSSQTFKVGKADITLTVDQGYLISLGSITVNGVALRNPQVRFLPWFDSYEGEIFDRFELVGVRQRGEDTVVALQTVSNGSFPFREQRDSSGDLCFRNLSYDAKPVVANLAIVFKPAAATVGGRSFTGFTYWFEYDTPGTPIHRLLDRSSWELGGNLDDVNFVCRNWLTPPRMKIARATIYSTVGLDKWAALLPGNMWARWSLLPGFDMQYGRDGILVGWFDQVSLVRTTIESNANEDAIRFNDFHWFEQSSLVSTNAKTILHCSDRLDHTDALNLWTALQDRDCAMGRRQFGFPVEEPPRLTLGENIWCKFHYDTSYEHVVATAAEFGMDQVFVDPGWEQGQALKESLEAVLPRDQQKDTIFSKIRHRNMCCVLDFKIADIYGGEAALKRLCDRAASKGVKVITWIGAEVHPHSVMVEGSQCGEEKDDIAQPLNERFNHGKFGPIAATESGRHPWTGYAGSCWPLNLNSPVYDYLQQSVLGLCKRTGLAGYLWDSYSNMGWWQVDYSNGSMRPQFDKMGGLYAAMVNSGLYVMPEGILGFSSHSCCGLHGGDVYAGELLGYSYDSNISVEQTAYGDDKILRGEAPAEMIFRCLAHRRVPCMNLHRVPRNQWNATAVAALKEYFAMYKAARGLMLTRTVLKDDAGVLWTAANGERLLWSFRSQAWSDGTAVDLLSGAASCGQLAFGRVYRLLA